MPYIDGSGTLAARPHGAPDGPGIARLLEGACDGLDFLHAHESAGSAIICCFSAWTLGSHEMPAAPSCTSRPDTRFARADDVERGATEVLRHEVDRLLAERLRSSVPQRFGVERVRRRRGDGRGLRRGGRLGTSAAVLLPPVAAGTVTTPHPFRVTLATRHANKHIDLDIWGTPLSCSALVFVRAVPDQEACQRLPGRCGAPELPECARPRRAVSPSVLGAGGGGFRAMRYNRRWMKIGSVVLAIALSLAIPVQAQEEIHIDGIADDAPPPSNWRHDLLSGVTVIVRFACEAVSQEWSRARRELNGLAIARRGSVGPCNSWRFPQMLPWPA